MIQRALLFLAGLTVAFLGLNVSLGGITTMRWQEPVGFYAVAHKAGFLHPDNHVRFLGGIFLRAGSLFVASNYTLDRLRPVLIARGSKKHSGSVSAG